MSMRQPNKVEGKGRWEGWTLWMDPEQGLVRCDLTDEAYARNKAYLESQSIAMSRPKPEPEPVAADRSRIDRAREIGFRAGFHDEHFAPKSSPFWKLTEPDESGAWLEGWREGQAKRKAKANAKTKS